MCGGLIGVAIGVVGGGGWWGACMQHVEKAQQEDTTTAMQIESQQQTCATQRGSPLVRLRAWWLREALARMLADPNTSSSQLKPMTLGT